MMRTGKVLVVSADETVRLAVTSVVKGMGPMFVTVCASAEDALAYLARCKTSPDIAIVAPEQGDDARAAVTLDLCRALIHSDTGTGAALMLLLHDNDEAEVLRAFAAGARDVLRLPFRTNELAARIRVLARSQVRQCQATFEIGAYVLRAAEGRLLSRDLQHSIRLTDKEVNIIRYLYQAEGSVVSKFDLLENVWNYSPHTDTHTLETHMYRLRLKFDGLVPGAQPIETVGGGYRIGPAASDTAAPARYRMRWPRRAGDLRRSARAAGGDALEAGARATDVLKAGLPGGWTMAAEPNVRCAVAN